MCEYRESWWASELKYWFLIRLIFYFILFYFNLFYSLLLFISIFFLSSLVSFFHTGLFSPLRPPWLIAAPAFSIGVTIWNLIIIIIIIINDILKIGGYKYISVWIYKKKFVIY